MPEIYNLSIIALQNGRFAKRNGLCAEQTDGLINQSMVLNSVRIWLLDSGIIMAVIAGVFSGQNIPALLQIGFIYFFIKCGT